MLYFRGHSQDFEEWEKLGNPGWGWRDVLPFFKKAEGFAGANEDNVYGTDGNFRVMYIPHLYKVCKIWVSLGSNLNLQIISTDSGCDD